MSFVRGPRSAHLTVVWAVSALLVAGAWVGVHLGSATPGSAAVETGAGSVPEAPGPAPAAPSFEFPSEFFFQETGLAYATSWSANITGISNGTVNATANSINNTIQISEPTGTYLYFVPAVPGYLENFSGNITTNSTNLSILIVVHFSPYPQWAPAGVLAGVALWAILVAAIGVVLARRP